MSLETAEAALRTAYDLVAGELVATINAELVECSRQNPGKVCEFHNNMGSMGLLIGDDDAMVLACDEVITRLINAYGWSIAPEGYARAKDGVLIDALSVQ